MTSSSPPDRSPPNEPTAEVDVTSSASASDAQQTATVDKDRGEPARPAPGLRAPSFRPEKSYRETRRAYEREFERRYAEWLLNRHSGNLSAAAREARMDRKYLYELARRHGLRDRRRPPTED